ncbi:SMI1/KNR4 family protein [Streptomyces sp. NPDC056638]|uniref:SMI1/KNR4 family protein n=1 Tax=Streptomyces sp. NPDC056638 TaxID=3345887 RepID=UPI0036AE28D0
MPPPATSEAVAETEEVIGFLLPPLLRRLYIEVANGGFGPDEGILGVRGGAFQGNFADIAELYQDGPDSSGHIPAGLVLIYDWGCTLWSLVDFRDPTGPMRCNHQGEHWPQGITLAEWLTSTLAGTLTVDTLLEGQPAS